MKGLQRGKRFVPDGTELSKEVKEFFGGDIVAEVLDEENSGYGGRHCQRRLEIDVGEREETVRLV